MIPSAVFVKAVTLPTKFQLFSKFFRNPGSIPKMFTNALSTSRKHTTGFLVKSFGGRCVCTVLTAACYCMAVKSLYSYSEVCVRVGRVKS